MVENVFVEVNLPDTAVEACQAKLRQFVPFRECSDKDYFGGIWRPFAEDPAAFGLVQAEILMCVSEIHEISILTNEFCLFA